jgi:hypothetical protein
MKHNFYIAVISLAFLFSAAPGLTPGNSGKAWAQPVVSVKGELRVRPEMRDNADFDSSKDDKQAFTGSRTRVTIDVKTEDDVSAVVTLQDARKWAENAGNLDSGREKEAVDIFEAYAQAKNIAGQNLGVKAGRQTLVYGDQRLLGHLGWQDNARAHDALKVMLGLGSVNLDVFASKEAESMHTSDATHDSDLNGAYAVMNVADGVTVDVYALQWKTAATKTTTGTDAAGAATTTTTPIKDHNIMTIGARAAAKMGGLDATAEFASQSGDWAEGVTQSASAFAVTAGYKLDVLGGTRIGVEYDQGSGDDNPADKSHKTFVFPFHTNHMYYGYMDYFSWGNMKDMAVKINTNISPALNVALDFHTFTLAAGQDDWLNVAGIGVFKKAVKDKTSTAAGSEIDLTVNYKAWALKVDDKPVSSWNVTAGYSMFTPGQAAKDRSGGKGDASTWGYVMSTLTF